MHDEETSIVEASHCEGDRRRSFPLPPHGLARLNDFNPERKCTLSGGSMSACSDIPFKREICSVLFADHCIKGANEGLVSEQKRGCRKTLQHPKRSIDVESFLFPIETVNPQEQILTFICGIYISIINTVAFFYPIPFHISSMRKQTSPSSFRLALATYLI
jgi:hypothetical protein